MSVEVMRSHTNKEGQRPKAATSGGQSSKMHQLVVVYRIWIFFVCLFGSLFAAIFNYLCFQPPPGSPSKFSDMTKLGIKRTHWFKCNQVSPEEEKGKKISFPFLSFLFLSCVDYMKFMFFFLLCSF